MSTQALSTVPADPAPRRRFRSGIPYGRMVLTSGMIVTGILGAMIAQQALSGHLRPLPPPHWPSLSLIVDAPPVIQAHLYTILGAIAVGGVLMSGVKGSILHRVLGWIWVVFMVGTATLSLFIKSQAQLPHIGPFGPLHIFSVLVLVQVPLAVVRVKQKRIMAHGKGMAGVFLFGVLIAGVFAFLPGRLVWQVFFG